MVVTREKEKEQRRRLPVSDKETSMTAKVLLVGWDAADWKIIQPLMDAGHMPTTQRLVEGGVMADLLTLAPILSPVLWTTIATGKRPHKHGILGFTEPMPTGVGVQPITNVSRKTKAVWNILNQNGLRSNVVGWWPSSPVEPINGVMVSNHYQEAPGPAEKGWPLPPNTVHPPEMADALASLRIHPEDITAEELLPFVPEGARIDQSKDQRLASLVKIVSETATIQACALHLMEHHPADLTAVYFDGIDHFCHAFMRYHPPQLDWVSDEDFRIYQNVVRMGYVFHDMMLDSMLKLAGDDTTVIIVSDHGFHPDHMRRKQLPNEPAGPANEHREHGMFLMHGPGVRKDELIHGISLLDITPTILSVFGLPAGDDMDGRVLEEAFEQPDIPASIPSWDDVPGDDGQHPADMKLDADAAQESVEQLVALGYIERPSGDGREAAEKAAMENQYNLARSFIHGGMHGEAVPILAELYERQPLEFRFGIQLAICLKALEKVDDLAELVNDLRERWQSAAVASRKRPADIANTARDRKKLADKMEAQRREELGDDIDKAAPPMERLFTEQEQFVICKLRSIARGNIRVLDYMDGWVAMARGDHEAALALFQKHEADMANDTGLHFQLGEAYRELQRADKATSHYNRVLELDPHDAQAYLGLARTYHALSRFEDAQEAARAALARKFHLPLAHGIVGDCEDRAGNRGAAVAAYKTALSMNPNYAQACDRLAELHSGSVLDEDTAAAYRDQARSIREARRAVRTGGMSFIHQPVFAARAGVDRAQVESIEGRHRSPSAR